jgi:carbamoyltransferase
MIKIGSDGSYWLDLDYFAFHYSPDNTLSPKFSEAMGMPPSDPAVGDESID